MGRMRALSGCIAMPDELQPAILLSAFAGLRVAEVSGLRGANVDYMRGTIVPAVQYPADRWRWRSRARRPHPAQRGEHLGRARGPLPRRARPHRRAGG
jgi:hypothetical protein